MSNITKRIVKLAISKKSVFTTDELALAWKITNKNVLRVTINRSIKNNFLKKIRRGIYSLDKKEINVFELACKLKKRSYISFETVLSQEGIIFQWQDKIFLASDRTSEIKNKQGKFVYKKIPDKALYNNDGIINKKNYFIATKERALCDKIYKDGISYFDDLSGIDRKKIFRIARLYNKRLERDIKKIL
ncbi:hypothetical protein KAR28_02720 [Candidatus Parcubacteria bacterium]|nr:hypothetical protein [Candidatus Parcubacteria bacterium]